MSSITFRWRIKSGSIEMGDKLKELLEYVKAVGRICPNPQEWQALWEIREHPTYPFRIGLNIDTAVIKGPAVV